MFLFFFSFSTLLYLYLASSLLFWYNKLVILKLKNEVSSYEFCSGYLE